MNDQPNDPAAGMIVPTAQPAGSRVGDIDRAFTGGIDGRRLEPIAEEQNIDVDAIMAAIAAAQATAAGAVADAATAQTMAAAAQGWIDARGTVTLTTCDGSVTVIV